MRVDYVDHMGSDLTVVNAARVSFDKHHEAFEQGKDDRLISYLAVNGHWTPFAHAIVQLRVTAPVFVANQLKRHQIGFALNEVSRRYVDSPPEFETLVWRKRPDASIKQGSGEKFGKAEQRRINALVDTLQIDACAAYLRLVENFGVAPEQARAVLPMSTHTSWYWTGSLVAWARLCRQRMDPDTQGETQSVAREIDRVVAPLFPVSWACLLKSEAT